uniref:Alpha/beta hydrolase fold-3 domain-containing protein n=1 Tax=Oryza punctata TaxID=4537 RepID=A0A0E0M1L5_ORYPU
MSTNRSSPARNASGDGDGDIAIDLFPFLCVYKDGRIKRYGRHTSVPASSDEKSPNGIVTKDVVVDDETGVSVRLFLPVDEATAAAAAGGKLLPLVVYIHGGGFCTGSASSPSFRPLAGESAGATIVHNVALRAAAGEDGGGIDIEGIILLQPCFWGTKRLPCEKPEAWRAAPEFPPEKMDALWPFVTAGAVAGSDDPRMNPPAEAVASLLCRRALVTVAEDILRDRGRQYAARLRDGAWGGEVTFVESMGVDHCFHLSPKFNPKAVELMDRVVEFIAKGKTTTPAVMLMKQRRRRSTLHGKGSTKKTAPSSAAPTRGVSGGPRCMAQAVSKAQQAGSGTGNLRAPSKAQKYDVSAAGLEKSVFRSCL